MSLRAPEPGARCTGPGAYSGSNVIAVASATCPAPVVLLLTVFALACAPGGDLDAGTPHDPGHDAGPTSLPLEKLCASAAVATCADLIRCGLYATDAGCFAASAGFPLCDVSLAANVDAGVRHYDAAQALACVAALKTVACSEIPLLPSGCSGVFTGTAAVDATCASTSDCAPPNYCLKGVLACGGVCTVPVRLTDPVTGTRQCVEGAGPADGTCVPNVARGESCGAPDGGAFTLPCEPGLDCSTFQGNHGVTLHECTARVADAPDSCQDPAAAISGCQANALCNQTTGLCEALRSLDAGCDPSALPPQCQRDLWCNGGLGTPACQLLSDVDGPCFTSSDCLLGGACDGGPGLNSDGGPWFLGTCTAPAQLALKADGETCTLSSECMSAQCTPYPTGAICGPCHSKVRRR